VLSTTEIRIPSTSAVLIGADRRRRRDLADALGRLSVRIRAEIGHYPSTEEAAALASGDCDVVMIDLDEDPQRALTVVEDLSRTSAAVTVMVYSRSEDPELVMQCMRAGARELIQEPISGDALASAIVRTASRRATADRKRIGGKSFLFWSVKGGAGASTLAAAFALSIAKESGQKVALVDLNLELGDLAVLLDLKPRFSIADALDSADRMDWDFLSSLMVDHDAGVSLLAAPEHFQHRDSAAHSAAICTMIHLLQEQFAYIVVDAPTGRGLAPAILTEAEAIYLVSQVDIPSLRHAQRLSAHVAERVNRRGHLHMVLNRYDARQDGIGLDEVEKALSLPVAWRVPNDYSAVRNAANTGATAELMYSPVGRTIRQMALAACGKTEQQPAKKGWRLFG